MHVCVYNIQYVLTPRREVAGPCLAVSPLARWQCRYIKERHCQDMPYKLLKATQLPILSYFLQGILIGICCFHLLDLWT